MSEGHSTGTKRCAKCKETKPVGEFGTINGIHRSYCRTCRLADPRGKKPCERCGKVKALNQFNVIGGLVLDQLLRLPDGEGMLHVPRGEAAGRVLLRQVQEQERRTTGYCRVCNTTKCRQRSHSRIKSGEAVKDYKERYKTKRWEKLLKQYGVDQKSYEGMERAAEMVGAICGNPETKTYKYVLCRLVVDHDHETGKVRGLLCRSCNVALGNFYDDRERLLAAVRYLGQE